MKSSRDVNGSSAESAGTSNRSILDADLSHQKIDPGEDLESASSAELPDVVHRDILQALKGLQFGEVTITVRDGRVVQIERITRRRQIISRRSS